MDFVINENIQQILIKENLLNNHLYLYKSGAYWIAYEQSAFHLFSIGLLDYCFNYMLDGIPILIGILVDSTQIDNPRLKVKENTEKQRVYHSSIICKGFSQWKYGFHQVHIGEIDLNKLSRLR